MTKTTLETLPQLVLDLICENIARCDIRRRTLFSFSLVSKRCRDVSNTQRFNRICLEVHGHPHLEALLGRWNEILGLHGYEHVRHIQISGGVNIDGPKQLQGTWFPNDAEEDFALITTEM